MVISIFYYMHKKHNNIYLHFAYLVDVKACGRVGQCRLDPGWEQLSYDVDTSKRGMDVGGVVPNYIFMPSM